MSDSFDDQKGNQKCPNSEEARDKRPKITKCEDEGGDHQLGDETFIYTEWDCKNHIPEGFTGAHKRVGRPSVQNEINGLERKVQKQAGEIEQLKDKIEQLQSQFIKRSAKEAGKEFVLAIVDMVLALQRLAIHKFAGELGDYAKNIKHFHKLSDDQHRIMSDCKDPEKAELYKFVKAASDFPFHALRNTRNAMAHPNDLTADLNEYISDIELIPVGQRKRELMDAFTAHASLMQISALDKYLLEAYLLKDEEDEERSS